MLLRHRVPPIPRVAPPRAGGLDHLDERALAVLRWLADNRIDFILVGAVARQVRGERGAGGPVSIVVAPYGRNLDRLARALNASRARLRVEERPAAGAAGGGSPAAGRAERALVRMDAQQLLRAQRWTLACGEHELDIEGHPPDGPRYQELLYEASGFTLAEGLVVQVASPEDIEHYEHVRRTGVAPQIRVSRAN
jgi:hypothetical protein